MSHSILPIFVVCLCQFSFVAVRVVEMVLRSNSMEEIVLPLKFEIKFLLNLFPAFFCSEAFPKMKPV